MNDLAVIDQREVLGKNFKMYGDFENPLFLAKDVAEWIDYSESNVSKMLLQLMIPKKPLVRLLRAVRIIRRKRGFSQKTAYMKSLCKAVNL